MTSGPDIRDKARVLERKLRRASRLAWSLLGDPSRARDIGGALLRGGGGLSRARCMALTVSRPRNIRVDFSISRKFQWIWIRIAKTAGRSIKTALSRADPGMEFVPGRTIAEVYALYPEVRDYRTFAFIRHPFERALSFYADLFLPLTGYPEDWFMAHMMARQALLREFHGLAEVGSFDDYCEWLNTPWASDRHADRHFRSQICAIRLRGGRLPDFIGRLENIDQDFPRFADHVGMPAPALPMLGTRAGWSAAPDAVDFARAAMRAHLTDRNRALLAARYEGDLEVYLSLSAGGPGTSGPVGEAIRT